MYRKLLNKATTQGKHAWHESTETHYSSSLGKILNIGQLKLASN